MTKLLVLMLLIEQGTFVAGIETAEGLQSQTFANSPKGVEGFFAFAEPIVTAGSDRYFPCLVPVGEGEWGAIWEALDTEKIANAVVPQSALDMHGIGSRPDIKAAANACAHFLKIYGQKSF
jgi:hypothetical protein